VLPVDVDRDARLFEPVAAGCSWSPMRTVKACSCRVREDKRWTVEGMYD
jgi:hypothetical protein